MTQPDRSPEAPAPVQPDPAVEADLRRVARRIVQDAALADDVVQETWLTALQARGLEAPPGWLRQVARRVALAARRKERRRSEMERSAARAEAVVPADERALDELRRTNERTLENTHGRIGDVMRLRYRDGLKLREIAERLEVPLGTVKSDHAQGLRRFRRALGDDGRDRHPAAIALAPLARELRPQRATPVAPAAFKLAAAVFVASAALVWSLFGHQSGHNRERLPVSIGTAGAARSAAAPESAAAPARTAVASAESAPRAVAEPGPAATETDVTVPATDSAADLVVLVTADGAPLPDVPVRAFGARMALLAEARTGPDGRAPFAALPRERLRTAGLSGASERPTVVVSAIDPRRATPHSVLAEVRGPDTGPAPVVEVALGGPALELRADVVDELGAPVAGARVLVDPDTQNPIPAGSGRWLVRRVERGVSDPGGAVVLRRLEPGRRTLVVDAEGFRTLRATFDFPTAGVQSLPSPLVLQRGATVRGRVVDAEGAAVAGAAIWSEREDNQPVRSFARSGADGQFELRGLPLGAHTLWAVGGSADEPRSAACTAELTAGAAFVWDPELIGAGLGRLRLVTDSGAPLGEVRVRLNPLENERDFVELLATDAAGEVHLPRDPGCPVRLTVIPATADNYLAAMPIDSFVVSGPWNGLRELVVGDVSGPRGRLTGRVAAVDGGRAAAVSLILLSHAHQFAIRVQVDADGAFGIDGLAPGEYELVVRSGEAQHSLWREHLSAETRSLGELRLPAELDVTTPAASGSPGG